jgi:ribonuclease T1
VSAVLRALAWAALAAFVAIATPASQAQFAPSAPAAQVAAKDLPKEAREALALVKKGGPFPYAKDGAVFGNREGRLPAKKRGYYREYTVKTPGERTRGKRRIVAGRDGDYWYTDDHYATFRRIRE